jgi:L-ascorbate metabolism protein UlaG (beta-lactamase superfamily)
MNSLLKKKNLSSFLERSRNGVFNIGHASSLLKLKDDLILLDPCWNYKPFSEYWSLEPEQYDCDEILDKVKFIIISHIHDDHYSEDILRRFKGQVVIMGDRPEFTTKLKSFGCDVIEVQKGINWFFLNERIKIRFIGHQFNPVDSSCFIVTDEFSFYHGNDNFAVLEDIKACRSELDYLDVATIPYAYLNWYPENMKEYSKEKKDSETKRLVQKMIDYANDLIKALDCKFAIPCGANLYYRDEYDSPFNVMGISPWDFKRASNHLHEKTNIMALTSGGYLSFGDDLLLNESLLPRLEFQFIHEVQKALSENKPKNLNAEVILTEEHFLKFKNKVWNARHIVENNIVAFVVNDKWLCANLETKMVSIEKPFNLKFNMTIIEIEPYQLMKWLDGELTYEMVVATRKFKMIRKPDLYNVKVFEFILNYL